MLKHETDETVPFDAHIKGNPIRERMCANGRDATGPVRSEVETILDVLEDSRIRAADIAARACGGHVPVAGFYPGYTAEELDDGRLDPHPTDFLPIEEIPDSARYRLNPNPEALEPEALRRLPTIEEKRAAELDRALAKDGAAPARKTTDAHGVTVRRRGR